MEKKSYTQPKMQLLGAISDKTKTKGINGTQDNNANSANGAQYS